MLADASHSYILSSLVIKNVSFFVGWISTSRVNLISLINVVDDEAVNDGHEPNPLDKGNFLTKVRLELVGSEYIENKYELDLSILSEECSKLWIPANALPKSLPPPISHVLWSWLLLSKS